jgi:hypothetical protein
MGFAIGVFLAILGTMVLVVGDPAVTSDLRTPGVLLCWIGALTVVIATP